MRGTEKMMLLCKIIFRQLNMPPSERYDRQDFARPANEREYVGETLGQERYDEAANYQKNKKAKKIGGRV